MDNNFTVCGLVLIDGKILLVRHTYGVAKGRLLLPGGYVMSGEMQNAAAEREILEETGVYTAAKSIISARFKPNEWLLVFEMEYLSGAARSDNYENSEVLLISPDMAVKRDDITDLSRIIIIERFFGKSGNANGLHDLHYGGKSGDSGKYQTWAI